MRIAGKLSAKCSRISDATKETRKKAALKVQPFVVRIQVLL
jgi:hypothetical protein